MKVIQQILTVLNERPKLTYEFENAELLHVYSAKAQSTLTIAFWGKEHTLWLRDWHWHFNNDKEGSQELVVMLTTIISNHAYLKVLSKDNKPYSWELVTVLPSDNVSSSYRTGLLNHNWLKRPSIHNEQFEFV